MEFVYTNQHLGRQKNGKAKCLEVKVCNTKRTFMVTRVRMEDKVYADRDSQTDLNNDGVVNMNDLAIFTRMIWDIMGLVKGEISLRH